MEVNKICLICQQQIHSQDNFIELIDYKQGEIFRTGYYHNSCWHQAINKANTMMEKVMERLA